MKEVSPRRRADQVSLLLVSQVRWEFEIDHWIGERNLAVVVVLLVVQAPVSWIENGRRWIGHIIENLLRSFAEKATNNEKRLFLRCEE